MKRLTFIKIKKLAYIRTSNTWEEQEAKFMKKVIDEQKSKHRYGHLDVERTRKRHPSWVIEKWKY